MGLLETNLTTMLYAWIITMPHLPNTKHIVNAGTMEKAMKNRKARNM